MVDQGEFFDIDSPCRRICELNNRGYCKGCFRSRDERLYWNQFTTFQKQLVVNLCEKRRLKVLANKTAEEVVLDDTPIPQLDLFEEPSKPNIEASSDNSVSKQEEHSTPPEAKPTKVKQTYSTKPLGNQFDLF